MKKWLIAVGLLVLAACSTQADSDNDLTTIRLSEVTRSVFYAPLYVAIERGYFEEEGIVIDMFTSDGADNVMTALLTDAADIGLSGPEAAIYVYLGGAQDHAVVFSGLTARDGSFLIAREPMPDFTWTDVAGFEMLPGRPGGMPFMVLSSVLDAYGVLGAVELNTAVQFQAMMGAFLGGEADFVTAFEPVASTIELEGRGYVVASIGESTGELPYTVFYARSSFIEENPELIQGFTNAIARAGAWVANTHPAEIAALIAPFFPEAELEILASAIYRYQEIGAYQLTPYISAEAFYLLQDIMILAGELETRVPAATLIDNRFAIEAEQ